MNNTNQDDNQEQNANKPVTNQQHNQQHNQNQQHNNSNNQQNPNKQNQNNQQNPNNQNNQQNRQNQNNQQNNQQNSNKQNQNNPQNKPNANPEANVSRLIQERIKKIDDIRALNVNPFPYKYEPTHISTQIKEKHKELPAGEHTTDNVCVAGRILLFRRMGKICFIKLQDLHGDIQVYSSQETLGEKNYEVLKKLDLGDIVGFKGMVFATKTGEITVDAHEFTLLCKSIMPLPDKFHGLADKELRYRQRYVDLIVTPEVKRVFEKRSLIIKSIREFLDKQNFMEVETPLLQTQYGGASARPFVTHINAWDMKMFLSISPELYLKRLVVGGFERVYTICKNFRNEGVDQSHNPEFTMIEIYQAYADYNDMMKLIEECYEYVCLKVNGTTKVLHKSEDGSTIELDFKAPWKKMTLFEAVKSVLNIDVEKMSVADLEQYCIDNRIAYDKITFGGLVMSIFDEKVEDKIIQPTHIYDRPKEATPLCKRHRIDDRLNEQCEPICMGMELGNLYSELNDPVLQEQLLKEQAEFGRAGNEEAHPMDEDFLNAIKVGLPPTGGIGWGIDRMAIVLLGQESIRDVIFFPIMKPNVEKKQ
jgi:lysyl-tRNA synthetase class 2